ncbi:MAG TPA: dTDP-4-dehydrorhamnose 3,5-epimerase [Ignavibacteriaceae bacterium]|nr:dTDP-4-dehydrorhamnose 3,5-epimerase [Ignavibacteriaceae bacterium]
MEIIKTDLEGLLVIHPKVFSDSRGYFFESYRKDILSSNGIDAEFIQGNISKSKKNTIRGLHYQVGNYAQGKLCQVILGKILDVAVDIRFNSPTFGKYFSQELSEDNHTMIWMPPGFAHGFSVLSDEAVFLYKCTAYYNKENERAILYNDSDLNIDWKIKDSVVSEKDLNAKLFKNIDRDFE